MNERKFEAHITCPRDSAEIIEQLANPNWKFSCIDGDPMLGKQAYCYLTAYDTDAKNLKIRVTAMAQRIRAKDIQVLREKIEEIIYDTKTEYDIIQPCCGHCGAP
jgi:hypothetical protein